MTVTAVNFRKFRKKRLVGFCSIEFDDSISINGFKVVLNEDGELFVAMPSHCDDEGNFYNDVFIKNEGDYEDFQADVIGLILDDYDFDDIVKSKGSKSKDSKSKGSKSKGSKSKGSKSKARKPDVERDEDEDEDDGWSF